MARRWLLSFAVAVLVMAILFPVYWMAMTALLPSELLLARDPPLLPRLGNLQLGAIKTVFFAHPFLRWLVNSMLVAAGTVIASLLIAVPAGYSLSRRLGRPQEALGLGLLVSKMLPGSIIVIPFFVLASRAHLIDSRFALILANVSVGIPFATWMMKGFFDGVPRDLEAAASVDGCTRWQAFTLIILPLARPGLVACAIYLFILAWSDFVFARTLINNPDMWTIAPGLLSFFGGSNIDWGALMAAGTISLLPVLILFLLLEPLLVGGLTAGSDK